MRGRIALLKHFRQGGQCEIHRERFAISSWSRMRCWAWPRRRSRSSRRRRRRCNTGRYTWRRGWCSCRCRSSSWTWRWCRSAAALAWCLDFNCHRRAGLKEAYCRVGDLRRLIGIEPEVIQRAPANRVGVLISREGFRVPGDRSVARLVIIAPRSAAISSVSLGAIVWPTGMLRRCVESNVTYVNSGAEGHAEGLNCAVEIHVKERILIVPNASRRVSYLVAHKPNTIVTRIGLNWVHCCARTCPGLDSWLRSHRATGWRKAKIRRAAGNRELTIGEIVKHVALAWMRLAPREFMRADVGGFAKVGRAGVLPRDQVTRLHQDSVRYAVVIVAAVVVRVRWERSGERIDPCTRTDAALVAIQS